jgi:predicted nucleic-acid-binding protein
LIALDTNLIVRLVVQDDPGQVAIAERILRTAVERGEPCFLSDPVLCELEWVLTSCYKAQHNEILAAVQELLAQELFHFENRDAVRQALDAYQTGKADFSDYLIGAKGHTHGAKTTFTFDRNLRGRPEFTVLEV